MRAMFAVAFVLLWPLTVVACLHVLEPRTDLRPKELR